MPQSVCPARAAEVGFGGFGAGDIFRYQLLSENIRARCAVRLAESGVGAGRECPKYSGKGAELPAPHSASNGASFSPARPVRLVRANTPTRAGPLRIGAKEATGAVWFVALAVRRSRRSGRLLPPPPVIPPPKKLFAASPKKSRYDALKYSHENFPLLLD